MQLYPYKPHDLKMNMTKTTLLWSLYQISINSKKLRFFTNFIGTLNVRAAYRLSFLYCVFVLLLLVLCMVSSIARVSGLSIFDCPLGFL